tara:strand:+ start:70 stop:657 length:588 start_codon:yes stop_codon:yes gene_type:complete
MRKRTLRIKDRTAYNNDRYDEMKSLLNKSRKLFEQVEDEVETEEIPTLEREKEITKDYNVSSGLITVHAYDRSDLELTDEEQSNYQETMDDFIEQVSDLVDFNALNMYENNIEWSGRLVKFDIDYYYSVGEKNGVYISGNMVQVDEDFSEMMETLKNYYNTFSSKWAKVLADRKSTKRHPESDAEVEDDNMGEEI